MTLPAPMVPREVDLRDFPYMPLDVQKLLNSDLWLTESAKICVICVTLWARSWHQIPAGSLPDDAQILARLSGAGRDWARIADRALRGFVLCSDGRYYHPVIAEKAIEAWDAKRKRKAKAQAAANARWSADAPSIAPSTNDPMLGAMLEECQGEGIREGKKKESISSELPLPEPSGPSEFDRWYSAYPKHEGVGRARTAFKAARKKATLDQLLAGVERYKRTIVGKERQFVKQPASWLNGEHWLDGTAPKVNGHANGHAPRKPRSSDNSVLYNRFKGDLAEGLTCTSRHGRDITAKIRAALAADEPLDAIYDDAPLSPAEKEQRAAEWDAMKARLGRAAPT